MVVEWQTCVVRGHVRARSGGWEIRAYAGVDVRSGKRRYVTRTVHGSKANAERALKIGLVSEVVPQAQLDAAGTAMAKDMLVATPLALRRTKETFNLCLGLNDLDAVLKIEGAVQGKLGRMDHGDRMQAFLEKR